MLTVIVAGRNDDYGKDFRSRLFRTALHNSALLNAAGIQFEYILAEWNPLPDRPALAQEFVEQTPNARAVIIPSEIHQKYSLNPQMPFHEMAAKNAALRRARGDVIVLTNADILFTEALIERIAAGRWAADTLYRAHRIDVNPNLSWREIKKPENQLASGEGTLSPAYYMGAGGDFCLAVRELWHRLGGFNERIRFSTRAKDWQFFLSAAAQHVGIEFIGDVYHLDHEGGLRNTSPSEQNAETVHFGRWWDIEFGLPLTAPDHWGFSGVRENFLNGDRRLAVLEPNDYSIRTEEDRLDHEMMSWLMRPAGRPDAAAGVLLHAICAAHREHRRLVCRISDPALAVTLSGFERVASRFGMQIHCNWNWPDLPGYAVRPFAAEPDALWADDWILEESAGLIRVWEQGGNRVIDVLPHTLPLKQPEFNPLLARRLLYAYLRLQEAGMQQIAIYGAGSHTRSLLDWGLPDHLALLGFIQSDPASAPTPAKATTAISSQEGDSPSSLRLVDIAPHVHDQFAILLSSASFESDMQKACTDFGIPNVIALYADWPRDMWSDRYKPSQMALA